MLVNVIDKDVMCSAVAVVNGLLARRGSCGLTKGQQATVMLLREVELSGLRSRKRVPNIAAIARRNARGGLILGVGGSFGVDLGLYCHGCEKYVKRSGLPSRRNS